MGGSAYQYDALGHRIQQTVGGSVSGYLNDLGAGLPTVLSETSGANVTRYLHGPRGLHQLQTPAGAWQHAFADALGSLRLVTDSAAAVLDSRSYGPYGDPFGQAGSPQTGYGYSGEPADANGLVYDRARYFNPALGQFVSLDPLEVFNRYAYVNGNPVMRTDPSGMLILMSETGGVSAKPVVKTTPVVRWAQNANPNPQPYSPPRTTTIQPVTPWPQNANPNPQPATPPVVSTPNTAANTASVIGPEPPPQRNSTSPFYTPLLRSGCPQNPAWWDILGNRCWDLARGLAARFNAPVENFSWMSYAQLEMATLQVNALRLLNDASVFPSMAVREDPGDVARSFLEWLIQQSTRKEVWGVGTAILPNYDYSPAKAVPLALLGGIAIGIGSLLVVHALSRQDSSGTINEYRLSGLDEKVGTLAEHLAKALGKEIAGYPPPDPNPDDRATRGWCDTIRRVIQEIDGAGYTERQFKRDLGKAGISEETWGVIKTAVKAAADGPCKDHWGGFTGGSLRPS